VIDTSRLAGEELAECSLVNVPVRLIASDLDGTLLGSDREVRPANVTAANAALDAGLAFVASTGRGQRSAHARLTPLPRVRWAVCSNGAVLYDRDREQIEAMYPVPGDAAAALIERLASRIDGIALAWETPGGFASNEAWVRVRPPESTLELTIRETPTTTELTEIIKILISAPGRSEDEVRELTEGSVGPDLTATSSGIDFVEITGPGVDKAHGLAGLCARLGIEAHEVMAFGDQRNDIPMLRWAGTGVAMANGHPDTLAVADQVAPHHDEDGVAHVVNQLLS